MKFKGLSVAKSTSPNLTNNHHQPKRRPSLQIKLPPSEVKKVAPSRMQIINEKTLKRDSWNMFVGESRYKTNFFLQFLDQATAALF